MPRLTVPLAHPDNDGAPVHALERQLLGLELRDGVGGQLDFEGAGGPAVRAAGDAVAVTVAVGGGCGCGDFAVDAGARGRGEQAPDGVGLAVEQGLTRELVPDRLLGVLREPVGEALEGGVHAGFEDVAVFFAVLAAGFGVGVFGGVDVHACGLRDRGRCGVQGLEFGVREVRDGVGGWLGGDGGPGLGWSGRGL